MLGLSMVAQPASATSCATGSSPNFSISVSCFGPYTWSSGNLSITNSGSLSGGTQGITSAASVGTLSNSGSISGTAEGISLAGIGSPTTIGALINNAGATILSTGTGSGGINIGNAVVGSVSNSGLISTARRGIDNEYTITSVINNVGGTILATSNRGQDIANDGTIGSVINNGALIVTGTTPNNDNNGAALAPNPMGIANYQTIVSVVNNGLISVSAAASATGIYNSGTIGTVTNTGTITVNGPASAGIGNYSTLTTVNNSGTITASGASAFGLYNHGSLAALTNSGLINASGTGAIGIDDRKAVITSLVNTGTISATGSGAIGISISSASGTIATIVSMTNSGTIAGQAFALANGGSLGLITNSGVIAGNIASSAQDITIDGGSNGSVGTLTGYAAGSVGTLTASGVTIISGSLLLNDNVVMNTAANNGTLTNNANLQVNQAIAINGNYVQASSGALTIGVSSATSYGELVVSGTANLANAHVSLASLGGFAPTAGESFTIVSSGTLSASGVTATTALPYSVTQVNNNLILSLSSWTQRADLAGGSALPVGPVLDQLASVAAYQPLLTQLSSLSVTQQYHAIKQLGVSQLTPQVNASGISVAPTTAAVEQHQLASLDGRDSGKAAGSDYLQGALWGQVLGGQATRDTSAGADGYTASSVGLLFGADTHLSSDLVSGLAVSWLRSYSQGKADSSGNQTEIDNYQLTAYNTWRPGDGPAYVQGLLGVGYSQYDQKRAIDYLGEVATADYHGWQYQGKVDGGYDLRLGEVTATPVGSMQVVRVANQAYTESGAGVANLAVNRQGFNAVESELGTKFASGFDDAWGHVAGDIEAAWVHSYTDSPVVTAAVMGGVGFVSTTSRPAADGLRLTTGVTLQQADGVSLRLEYDGDLRRDYRSHTGLLKLRSEF